MKLLEALALRRVKGKEYLKAFQRYLFDKVAAKLGDLTGKDYQ